MTNVKGRVRVDLSSLTPKAARKQLEETIGARLRGWIMRAECSFTDCAAGLGMQRPELYDLMEGVRGFKLAWLELLPVAVQRAILGDLAHSIGYELRPAPTLDESHDDDAAAVQLVHEALDAIRAITTTQADKIIDVQEAVNEQKELLELQDLVSRRLVRLRRVISREDRRLS